MPTYIAKEAFTAAKPFRIFPAEVPFEWEELPADALRGRGWRLASDPAPPPPPAPKQVPGSAPRPTNRNT